MVKKILIIGNGSREHALAWKLKQSPRVEKIYIAPGNPGTAEFGENVNIPVTDILGLADFAQKNKIDLTVVGPEDPLALGVVDVFQSKGLKIWGPIKAAAQIEGSKVFAKELMKNSNIPTAEFETFTDYNLAIRYIENHFNAPSRVQPRDPLISEKGDSSSDALLGMEQKTIVIKASGLASGKGVTVCKTLDEAKNALKEAMVDKIFGDSGSEVVIEEFLEGIEFSAHAFSDGKTFQLLPCSQDHKRIFDGDKGPNTGGVGTIAPLPWMTDDVVQKISQTIVAPILQALKDNGSPFVGLLYPGLMLTPHLTSPTRGEESNIVPSPGVQPTWGGSGRGEIKVIEFNCRFGGPECESYMRILKTDLLDILEACVEGTLDKINIEWHKKYASCIILCSGGYPDKYEKGKEITGIGKANQLDDVLVFHAGTSIKDGKLQTNGGRIIGVTATADDLKSALNKAYSAIKLIHFDGMHYRTDIGQKSLDLPLNSYL